MWQLHYLLPTKIVFSFLLYSIEHCIKEIQSEVNKQCPDVQLRTTTDCFEWLNNYNYNSSKSPSIPHGDLINFLKILVKIYIIFVLMVEWGGWTWATFHPVSIYKYLFQYILWCWYGKYHTTSHPGIIMLNAHLYKLHFMTKITVENRNT